MAEEQGYEAELHLAFDRKEGYHVADKKGDYIDLVNLLPEAGVELAAEHFANLMTDSDDPEQGKAAFLARITEEAVFCLCAQLSYISKMLNHGDTDAADEFYSAAITGALKAVKEDAEMYKPSRF